MRKEKRNYLLKERLENRNKDYDEFLTVDEKLQHMIQFLGEYSSIISPEMLKMFLDQSNNDLHVALTMLVRQSSIDETVFDLIAKDKKDIQAVVAVTPENE